MTSRATLIAALAVLVLGSVAQHAEAQDAAGAEAEVEVTGGTGGAEAGAEVEAEAGAEADAAPADAATAQTSGADTAAVDTATADTGPPPLYERRTPPPVVVAVIGGRRVPNAIVTAARAALVEQLGPLVRGRDVRALEDEAALEAIAACEEDACVGAQIAEAGAQAAAVLRLERARRGYTATLELRDPVSGAPRREPLEGELPRDADAVAEALAPIAAELQAAMPSPPPRPGTLTVTVNVDGARVEVAGHDLGASPIAPVDVAEGNYEIVVMAPGYAAVRRQTRVRAGEQARVDVTLREIGAEAIADAAASPTDGSDPWRRDEGGGDLTGEWWFWAIIGGGAAVLIGLAIGIGVAVSDSGPVEPMMPTQPDGIPLPPIMGGM